MTLVCVGDIVGAADGLRKWRTRVRTLTRDREIVGRHFAETVWAVVGLAEDVLDWWTSLVGLVIGHCIDAIQIVQVETEQISVLDRELAVAVLVQQHYVGVVWLDVVRTRQRVGLIEAGNYDVGAHQLLAALDEPVDGHQCLVFLGRRSLVAARLADVEVDLLDATSDNQDR